MSTGAQSISLRATHGIMRAAGFPFQAMRVVGDVEFAIAVIEV